MPDIEIEKEMEAIAQREEALQLERFDATAAFALGVRIKTLAEQRNVAVAIDVQLHEWPLFFYAMPGTTPNNADWIRRKRNVVLRFHKSSYAVGLQLRTQKTTLVERYGLTIADYAAVGGGVPLKLRGVGCIGAVTVSGLSQREDHELVIEALANPAR
jgi:uncharacterized protein (UPF0303 family)